MKIIKIIKKTINSARGDHDDFPHNCGKCGGQYYGSKCGCQK